MGPGGSGNTVLISCQHHVSTMSALCQYCFENCADTVHDMFNG